MKGFAISSVPSVGATSITAVPLQTWITTSFDRAAMTIEKSRSQILKGKGYLRSTLVENKSHFSLPTATIRKLMLISNDKISTAELLSLGLVRE